MKVQSEYHLKMKNAKIVQLVLMAVSVFAFFLIILINDELRAHIFTNPSIILLFTFTWVILLISIGFIVHDFKTLRAFDKESHDLARLAYLDNLTGIPNRYSCDLVFEQYPTPESVADISCVLMEISNIAELNEQLGRKEGDRVIRDFCRILEGVGDSYGFVGRNGGNEFLCIINESTSDKLDNFISELNSSLDEYNVSNAVAPINVHMEAVHNPDLKLTSLNAIISLAYSKLFA